MYERLALSRDKNGALRLAKEGNVIEKPEDIIKQPSKNERELKLIYKWFVFLNFKIINLLFFIYNIMFIQSQKLFYYH